MKGINTRLWWLLATIHAPKPSAQMVNRRSSHVRPVFTRLFGPFQWAVPTYLPVSLYVREGGYVIYKPSQYLSSASKPSPPWFLRACACSCARGVLSVRVITRFFPLSSHIKLRLKKKERKRRAHSSAGSSSLAGLPSFPTACENARANFNAFPYSSVFRGALHLSADTAWLPSVPSAEESRELSVVPTFLSRS